MGWLKASWLLVARMAGVQFQRQDVDAPKEEPKPKRQRRNRWGQDLSAAKNLLFVQSEVKLLLGKHGEEFKDLDLYEFFSVVVGFATKNPPFVFPSDDLEGTRSNACAKC